MMGDRVEGSLVYVVKASSGVSAREDVSQLCSSYV